MFEDVKVAPAGGQGSVTAEPANFEAEGIVEVGFASAKGRTASKSADNILLRWL